MKTYYSKQWAADSTHLSEMRDPPQKGYPFTVKLTCHGHSPGSASSPLIILLEVGMRPQADKNIELNKQLNWHSSWQDKEV